MNRLKTVTTVCGLALACALLAPSVKADEWNRIVVAIARALAT